LAAIQELSGRELTIAFGDEQAGDVRDTGAETSKAREHLGFVPATPLQTGIEAEFEWMKRALALR
jgi:UDP-glucose 4-epimerase